MHEVHCVWFLEGPRRLVRERYRTYINQKNINENACKKKKKKKPA